MVLILIRVAGWGCAQGVDMSVDIVRTCVRSSNG
jgi:hypothetical protein